MPTRFACDMSALTPEQRVRYDELVRIIRPQVIEFREMAAGYAARLPSEPEVVLRAAEFITLERLCCPFFNLAVEVENNRGPLWLNISGPEGIKPFIRAEFSIPSDD